MLSGFFADKPPYRKFFIVISVVLFCTIVLTVAGSVVVDLLYGVNMMDPNALSDLENPVVLSAMKMLQLLSTGIGMFLLPSLILAFLFSRRPTNYLHISRKPAFLMIILAVAIMFAAVPLINLMLVWNQDMNFPPFLSGIEEWMKASEDNATRITEALLNMKSGNELFYNLLIIAVLPALGEEFLFRGILMKLFNEITNNIHAAIIITAVIFSAIHMQFYGFVPRMMLGILFGYLYYWTGNLWVPVIAHFVNNGAAVVFAYFASQNELPFNQDTIGTTSDDLMLILASFMLVSGILYLFWKNRTNFYNLEKERDDAVSSVIN